MTILFGMCVVCSIADLAEKMVWTPIGRYCRGCWSEDAEEVAR